MRITGLPLFLSILLVSACASDSNGTDARGGAGGASAPGGSAGTFAQGGGGQGGIHKGGQGGTNAGGESGLNEGGEGGNPTMNANDEVARHACDAWAGKLGAAVVSKALNAVEKSDYAELGEAKLSVDGGTLYTITLPEGKESWVAVDENFWTATLGFFAPKDVVYEVRNADMAPRSNGPLKNGACPDTDLTDYRVFFPHWTPARIRFSAQGPRQVKFMIMRDEANSSQIPH